MPTETEKRRDERHDCDARIKWASFNRVTFDYRQEIFHRARALNFSKSGLYFETECSLKPGSMIFFRLEASDCTASGNDDCSNLRTISLIEIKWCQDFHKNGESCFGIGARTPYHIKNIFI